MEIYIEELLFQNILINLCLIKLIEITTKSRTKCSKIIISSIVGAGLSAITATMVNKIFLMNIFKIIKI